jgi:hypothetical protein
MKKKKYAPKVFELHKTEDFDLGKLIIQVRKKESKVVLEFANINEINESNDVVSYTVYKNIIYKEQHLKHIQTQFLKVFSCKKLEQLEQLEQYFIKK